MKFLAYALIGFPFLMLAAFFAYLTWVDAHAIGIALEITSAIILLWLVIFAAPLAGAAMLTRRKADDPPH